MALVLMAAGYMLASSCVESAVPKRAARDTAERQATAAAASTAFHPATRTTASPSGGETVAVNPPPLLWPAAERDAAPYMVQLSRDPAFPGGGTLGAQGLRWAMYNPHRQLEPGRWFWRHASEKSGAAKAWSQTHEFVIDPAARVFVTPAADVMLAAFPAGHPRILARADELAALRTRAASQPDCKALIDRARRLVKARLPAPEEAKPTQKGATAFEEKNFAKWASKAFAGDFVQDNAVLAPAYLLTGDAAIGRAALDRALFLAALDPEGDTSPRVSDFADGSCMRAMALAYDSCFALLTSDEAERLRQAMGVRAGRFFRKHVNSLEGRIFNPHVWQHILMEAAEVAFATVGELPEARAWTAYTYELWLNRFPPIAGDDGGWTEGLGYLGTNLETLLLMPQRLSQLTGVDFYDIPWYRNAASFHVYGWPVGSVNAGFGDGDHDSKVISGARAYFVETLGRRFVNTTAINYAQAVRQEKSDTLPALLVWHRLREPAPRASAPPPVAKLTHSRAFRDVGLVAMHTNLADRGDNLFVAFNSCPYGAFGHMHPAQNAFNVMLGGERLFANTGYYIAYGDAHFQGWYHNSRGHNTVLIDGQGQVSNSDGWGRIARYADSGSIAYSLGDASPAYGNAGLTRFRRHMVLLRPSTLVIYDELEADHPARWSWLLHSPGKITSTAGPVRLHAAMATGEGQVDIRGSMELQVKVDDRFDPPADNWRGKKTKGGVIQYPNQWHATIEPVGKTARTRFLALMQVRAAGQSQDFAVAETDGAGRVRLGPWTLQAALNIDAPPSLVIERADGGAALAAGVAGLSAGGRRFTVSPAETILVEGGTIFRAQEKSD
ncbi:MAG: DUF4962 domain-containing protein [Opitutaceae bacterium]|nr:DUF4962 domain-containing protein [Opitutaceae bacterium]